MLKVRIENSLRQLSALSQLRTQRGRGSSRKIIQILKQTLNLYYFFTLFVEIEITQELRYQAIRQKVRTFYYQGPRTRSKHIVAYI